MIHISNVNYRYPGNSNAWVLRGLNLDVGQGEYLLLCGASGSGKSSLGYLCNGLIPHYFNGRLEGSISVAGLDTRTSTVADFLTKVGVVFQNSEAQLFNDTVEDELAFGLESLGWPAGAIERQVAATAEKLGLDHFLKRSPHSLSGGEKRLVAIAAVLAPNPPILLLDEPLAHLDQAAGASVRRLLQDIHGQGGTVMVIEQRVGQILGEATRCAIMEEGAIGREGDSDSLYTVLQDGHILPRYSGPGLSGRPVSGAPVLAVDNLTCELGSREILHGISFEVREGEILALVGHNGSGKTTLVKHLNGLLRPRRGRVFFRGQDLASGPPAQWASSIGICFQNPNDQFFKTRVEDELLVGSGLRSIEASPWLQEVCRLFQLSGLLSRSPYQLSEGQKKRVAMASILARRPRVLILDEPTVGQDGRYLEITAGLLTELRNQGVTIILVTHDLEFARATADRWLQLHDGQLVEGPVEAALSPEKHECPDVWPTDGLEARLGTV